MDVEFIRYEFENGHSGIITKHGLKIGVRFVQVVYMIASAVVMGFVRGSIGVAVLAMNDSSRAGDTYIQIHNWDRRIQGAILSSFFFGYALMQLPCELYVKKLNCKLVFTAMLAVNGTLCVLMPTIANKGGWVAVCNAMLFMGMAQAGFHAVNQTLLARWLTPSEKKPLSCFVYGGIQLGIIIALPLAGLFSSLALGWELVFYSLAMVTLSMAVVYGTLTAPSPEDHVAIGDTEKEFISEAQSCYGKKKLSRPWRQILWCRQFWAAAGAQAAAGALLAFCLADLPAYLAVYHLSLRDRACASCAPLCALWAACAGAGPAARLRPLRYLLGLAYFRKLVNALGAVGVVAGLTLLGSWPPDCWRSAVVLLTFTLGLLGIQLSGFLSTYKDMSENHSGTLMMLGCAVSSLFGAAEPFVAGLIVGNDLNNPARWRAVLLTLSALYVLGSALFSVLGSSARPGWDTRPQNRILLHYDGVCDGNQVQLEEFNDMNISEKKPIHSDTAF